MSQFNMIIKIQPFKKKCCQKITTNLLHIKIIIYIIIVYNAYKDIFKIQKIKLFQIKVNQTDFNNV